MTTVSITRTDTNTELPTYQTGEQPVRKVQAALQRLSTDDRTDRERKLEEQLDRVAHENTKLREQLFKPRRDWRTITKAEHLTKRQYDAALAAPTVEQLRAPDEEGRPGALIAAELVAGVDHKPGWPVWLDELHHQQRIDAERWAPLHAMMRYEPRHRGHVSQSQAQVKPRHAKGAELPQRWEWAEYTEQPELAGSPESQAWIDQGPASDESMAGRVSDPMAAFNRRHGISAPVEPDDARVTPTPPGVKVGRWRDYGGIIAGAALGLAAFGALLVGSVVL